MRWDEFVSVVSELPVIDTKFLITGKSNPSAIKVQISRWQKLGKLIQLKRGLYILPEIYRKTDIYEPYIASILKKPSYISLEKALEFYGLIPEGVPVYTSVTTKRPGKIISGIGVFDYRHIKSSLFWGYKSITVNKQTAFMALPEKALLDLIYLKGVDTSMGYLEELRLQNVEKINIGILLEYGKKFCKPKILNAVRMIKQYVDSCVREGKVL